MTRVVVHIDRLILTGFGNEGAHAVGDGIRAEIARVLAEPASGERLASLGHVGRVDAGKIRGAQDLTPQRLGLSAGRAIAGALSR